MSPYCGTDTGYSRHRRRNEKPCQRCTEAHARAERFRAQAAARHRHRTAEHGTRAGVTAHAALRTPVCDRCLNWAVQLEADINASYLIGYRLRTAQLPMKDTAA